MWTSNIQMDHPFNHFVPFFPLSSDYRRSDCSSSWFSLFFRALSSPIWVKKRAAKTIDIPNAVDFLFSLSHSQVCGWSISSRFQLFINYFNGACGANETNGECEKKPPYRYNFLPMTGWFTEKKWGKKFCFFLSKCGKSIQFHDCFLTAWLHSVIFFIFFTFFVMLPFFYSYSSITWIYT